MEDYNKIIESLGVKYVKARNVRMLKPVALTNFYDIENTIILLNKGKISFGTEEVETLEEGEILFIPGGKMASVTYGGGNPPKVNYETYIGNKDRYYEVNKSIAPSELDEENFSTVTFEAKVFDTVNFFASLDIPPFVIKSEKLRHLVDELIVEEMNEVPGKGRIILNNTEKIVIETIRYILVHRLFVEQLATNSTYFKDPRLLNIFAYIKDEIGGDLSNKVLASVANVSEDYVGQYFKMLTGINPQDYIEYQRMEKAVHMLRTTKKSIREIGREVGYKDTAYFCRRFKMMFGIPAGKMRRRESLMNV
ncbi:AraC-type DNA-binding protein [Catalinimonas alkaloidigena]|uniref:AraC-type DNA-binding protein n=1 Tax=Catalinimonas alkaloidigena TaxID=1075417 RepID=A0A1G9EQT7_9BACT|nr:AraC family transcriptional regulator [Catalinimonas alkaloidigena]SDK78423.1 AraC-type DNA-binding protein [Catalinimonas alkaloidigena]